MDALENLKRAVMQNRQSAGQIPGLEEDYAQAQVKRDAPVASPNQYGYVSPLEVLGGIIRNSRGRAQSRDIKPQLELARKQQADSQGTLDANALKMSMEKAGREQESHDMKILKSQRALDSMSGNAENRWVNEADPEAATIAVGYDEYNKPYMLGPDGKKMPVPEGYVPEARAYYGSGGFRGKEFPTGFKERMSNDGHLLERTMDTASRFKDWYAQPTTLPTGFLNKLAVTTSRNDIQKYIDQIAQSEVDPRTKEAMLWWADWKMNYSLGQRHTLFGATLTDNELRSWEDAEQMLLGGDPEVIRQRMQKLSGDYEKKFIKHLNTQYVGTSLSQNKAYLVENGSQWWDEESGRFLDTATLSSKRLKRVPDNLGLPQDTWDTLDDDVKKMIIQDPTLLDDLT